VVLRYLGDDDVALAASGVGCAGDGEDGEQRDPVELHDGCDVINEPTLTKRSIKTASSPLRHLGTRRTSS